MPPPFDLRSATNEDLLALRDQIVAEASAQLEQGDSEAQH